MTTSSPHASSWPPLDREDDGVDLLASASRVVHQVSRAPRPVSSSDPGVNGPSVVIAPQAELPTLGGPREKRVIEPTLVIRDRQHVEDLRAGIRRADRRRARRRLRRALVWGTASALAFGFGTAVAFFAASSAPSEEAAGEVRSQAKVAGMAALTPSAAEDSPTSSSNTVPTRAAQGTAASGVALEEPARGDAAAEGATPGESPRPGGAPPGVQRTAEVISLADLPDAADVGPKRSPSTASGSESTTGNGSSRKGAASSTSGSSSRATAVVSLEDL